jgi:hypothetical protein
MAVPKVVAHSPKATKLYYMQLQVDSLFGKTLYFDLTSSGCNYSDNELEVLKTLDHVKVTPHSLPGVSTHL